MDACSSSRPGSTRACDVSRLDRLSRSASLMVLLLVGACSTVAPPTDPEPVANPLPVRPAVDDAVQVKPPARLPRQASRSADEGLSAGPEPKLEPLHVSANRPYRLNGRQFRPMTALQPFSERGIASWYGSAFHGRRTATGDRYDMNAMTAAHPTLPLPSYARVRNLKSGKVVIVRVNDRGPFANDRVIDLSRAAARHLGMIESGVASVEVELVLPDADPETIAAN